MTKQIEIPQTFLPNVKMFNEQKIDHVLAKNDAGIDLIIHGCPDNAVQFNGKLLNFSQLETPIRDELNLGKDTFAIVMVYCCYSLSMTPFFGNNMWIIPACNNENELQCEFAFIDIRLLCNFSYN